MHYITNTCYFSYTLCILFNVSASAQHVSRCNSKSKGVFFWDYSCYSYSGLGITEYTKFQFRKEPSYMFQIWKRNRGWPDLEIYYFPKERVFCLFRVNRIPSVLLVLLSGAEWTEWYSVHSENGIAPKRTQIPSIPSTGGLHLSRHQK